MQVALTPEQAVFLARRAGEIALKANEFGAFGETDPELAGACGVEVGCLEARTLLGAGFLQRIAAAASEAERTRRPVALAAEDIEGVSRLEAVVALGSSRIGLKMAALEAEAGQEGLARMGGLMGLASGAYGLIKSFF